MHPTDNIVTLSCIHYTIFTVVKSDLFIRALLLDRILVKGKNYAYASRTSCSRSSNQVITCVPNSIPEVETVNTATTQTDTNGICHSVITHQSNFDHAATVNNPKQSRHDVCFSGLHCSTTIDDIRAYLIDIGVANIESIALITEKANSKSNCFRVIITDESIKHSVT